MSEPVEKVLNSENEVVTASVQGQKSEMSIDLAAIVGDLLKNQQLNETQSRDIREKLKQRNHRNARKRLFIQAKIKKSKQMRKNYDELEKKYLTILNNVPSNQVNIVSSSVVKVRVPIDTEVLVRSFAELVEHEKSLLARKQSQLAELRDQLEKSKQLLANQAIRQHEQVNLAREIRALIDEHLCWMAQVLGTKTENAVECAITLMKDNTSVQALLKQFEAMSERMAANPDDLHNVIKPKLAARDLLGERCNIMIARCRKICPDCPLSDGCDPAQFYSWLMANLPPKNFPMENFNHVCQFGSYHLLYENTRLEVLLNELEYALEKAQAESDALHREPKRVKTSKETVRSSQRTSVSSFSSESEMRRDVAFEYAVKRLKNVEESQLALRERFQTKIMEMLCITGHERQDNQEVCSNVQGRLEILQDEKQSLTMKLKEAKPSQNEQTRREMCEQVEKVSGEVERLKHATINLQKVLKHRLRQNVSLKTDLEVERHGITLLQDTLAKTEDLNRVRAQQVELEMEMLREATSKKAEEREDQRGLDEAVALLNQLDEEKQLPVHVGRQVDDFLAREAPRRQKGVLMKENRNAK